MGKNWSWNARMVRFSGKRGERELLVRLLKAGEEDRVMQLQENVHSRMPDPSLLAEESWEEVVSSINLDVCLGVFDGEHLVAFSLMVVNRESGERNTGQKNGYAPEECVSFDTTFVDQDYHGLGLQAYLFNIQNDIARQLGAKYALVTVSPDNPYSLRNIRNDGFRVIARKRLYGGLDRYVMMKEI